MSVGNPLFTVMTPTYNRAHTLQRVYDSLCGQTCRDFEWLVVDDGSTDDTRDLIEGLRDRADFPVRYVWQVNQHKKAAFNHGVREAAGELIVALDSDDTLEPTALADMAQVWQGIDARDRHRYVAVTGLCVRPDGRIVGDRFPRDVMDTTPLDMSFRYRVRGEKFGCLSTVVLRRFPFPQDMPGFVPESLVWRAMARAGYLTRFVNQVFRVYHDSDDALSHQGKEGGQHALGLWMLAQDTVVQCLPWFRHDPMEFFKAAARYTRFGLHMRRNGQVQPSDRPLSGLGARLLVTAAWPVGLALYWRDRFRGSKAGA